MNIKYSELIMACVSLVIGAVIFFAKSTNFDSALSFSWILFVGGGVAGLIHAFIDKKFLKHCLAMGVIGLTAYFTYSELRENEKIRIESIKKQMEQADKN